MENKKYTSRILVLFIALAMTLSLVMPSAELSAYAAANRNTAVEASSDSGTGEAVPAETTSGAAAPAAASTEPIHEKSTAVITGYQTELNVARSKEAKITATITPASEGRLVKLQRYNHEKKKWYTKDRIYVTGTPNASVSFKIPKENRQRTSSIWRLYSPATDTSKTAVSDYITVTTRNIESYNLSAKAACVYRINADGTGTLVYSKNANTKRAQASTTKLMTAVLLMESGLLDSKTKISRHAAATPWGSGRLAAGDTYKTHDLLYAMLLPSANDAATAVAEKVGGSERAFVAMMNSKAKEMGMKKTHFCNPHGLDADGHYTTAKELAMLTAYAYTFPEIRECWTTQYKTIKSIKNKRRWTLWSTNSIFGYVSNFIGGKTGTEDNAGCCFTGVYEYNGSAYVTVVLGSGYGFSRWADTKKLHNYITEYAHTEY
ncbi:MAG: D-alanyl-D-alanine carboxypeptidase [Mogibacterium sp.]|nr:D-alanyl-D-alanine carboxypeptidase [Mogibacterium sp.]